MTSIQPTSRYLKINGLNLHHLDWGNPDAPTLVYVHGLTGTAHAFDGPARRFQSRYHIIATDVRGRGESAWSPEGLYEYEDYVADLSEIVNGLGLGRFTLVGTSMGGIIAIAYAGAHPDRLERLVINDIGPDVESGSYRISDAIAATPTAFASLAEVLEYLRQRFPTRARMSASEQEEQVRYALKQETDGRWVWKWDPELRRQRAASPTLTRPPLWPVLANLQCPTLVVWGMQSDVLSEAQSERMVKTLAHGQRVPVPGVGHAPSLLEPEAIKALDGFLVG